MIEPRSMLLALFLMLVAFAPVVAQDDPAQASGEEPSAARAALDSIQQDLIELQFEAALDAIEALLGTDDLSRDDRAEALVLRSQGHVALGDNKAAEEDYRQILALRPDYTPDRSMTPRKALERFTKVQDSMIGRVSLRIFPGDATITVDGLPATPSAEGELPLLAGEHLLRATADGFDPATQTVFVAAGRSASLELRLMPNARSVLILTEPDGVEVKLDGILVGETKREVSQDPSAGREPARLLLKNLPLGEHTFELSRDCYRTVRRTDFLDVDLMNVAPKRYDPIQLVPVRSVLGIQGGPQGAEVRVDGKALGTLPLVGAELCPGLHEIEVRRGERRIWTGTREFHEGGVTPIDVEARPNVLVVGAKDWPAALSRFRASVNETVGSVRLPRGDLGKLRSWERADLPVDVDLVLARQEATREGENDEWFVYSPILRSVDSIDLTRANLDRPDWIVPAWGLHTVDSEIGGAARVAAVVTGGSAATAGLRPGDRITAVGGAAVADTRQLERILSLASWKAPLLVEWMATDGSSRKKQLQARPSVRLDPGALSEAPQRAAWAMAESEGDGEWAETARANLALLYSEHGRHEESVRRWQRVGWEERAGIGRGTAQYYLGRELEKLGMEAEAIQAYREAAGSSGTALSDEGPPIAPAARDRLADLGVSLQ